MTQWNYTKGLHDLGSQVYAYLLPDGSWGWSNAGLIVGGDQSLLVDTLFDLRLTRDMLDTMRAAVPAAALDHDPGQHPRQRRPLFWQRAGPRRRDRRLAGLRRRNGRTASRAAGRDDAGRPQHGRTGRLSVRNPRPVRVLRASPPRCPPGRLRAVSTSTSATRRCA